MNDISAQIQTQLQKLDPKHLRLFACDCAENVLHYFEAFCPEDTRPREAIAIARLFAIGEANKDEMYEAMANAESAAYESSHKAWELVTNGISISFADEAAGSIAATTEACCHDNPFVAAEMAAKMAAIEDVTIAEVGVEAADNIWSGRIHEVDDATVKQFYEALVQERIWQLSRLRAYLPNQG